MKLMNDAIEIIIFEITATNLIFIDAAFFVASADIKRIFGHYLIFVSINVCLSTYEAAIWKQWFAGVGRVTFLRFSGNHWRFWMCCIGRWQNGGEPKVQ